MKLPQFVRWTTGVRWEWKVLVPIFGVLLVSIAAICLILRPVKIPQGQWILLALIGGAVMLSFTLLSVLLVMAERTLEELMRTADRVRNGDFGARVEFANRTDDLGQLGRRCNEMIEQLDAARKQVEELRSRDRKNVEEVATLGELAAGLAHEMRNPLAGIAGVVDIMSKELPANSPSRAVIGDVNGEIVHIQTLLNELLSYSRPRPPNLRAANLNTTVEQAVELARQQARGKPIHVNFTPEPSLPAVQHDPALIQQAVLNLLLNSIQAISGEGEVSVSSRQAGDKVVIQVCDTGRGISADTLPKIFKPFFTTRKEGAGLGLSLASDIVRSHGGRIEAASTKGKGSQFTVFLRVPDPRTIAHKS
jgi:two-component system, NtrC family, sensor kinase